MLSMYSHLNSGAGFPASAASRTERGGNVGRTSVALRDPTVLPLSPSLNRVCSSSREGCGKTGGFQPARLFVLAALFLLLFGFPLEASAKRAVHRPPVLFDQASLIADDGANQTMPLDVIQVAPPVLDPEISCTQTLMVHSFAFSYGRPYVGQYHPPACEYNRVTFNLTVTSAGRQFDRLALMYFTDTEVFRTSTAEPSQAGIIWTYVKDVSNFLTLFREPQKIIFDLGNLIDDEHTAPFNTTLSATFFTHDAVAPADVILPVSARRSKSDEPSAFVMPEDKASNKLVLPRNANKAVFSIAACGQAAEEFWWANVLSSDTYVFGNETTLYGYSPFRELQLHIDGTLAGVAWPFPVIFTGGVAPGLWRPIVGIDAFDLREDEIDISPFLPILSDGREHTFEIRVCGIDDDGNGNAVLTDTVGSNWVVTGKVFLWLDGENATTTGSPPVVSAPEPNLQLSSSFRLGAQGVDGTLVYSVKAERSFSLRSTVVTRSGARDAAWKQELVYANDGHVARDGDVRANRQKTSGTHTSTNYSRSFDYPLWADTDDTSLPGGVRIITASMDRAKNTRGVGRLAFPSHLDSFDSDQWSRRGSSLYGASVRNRQNGTATYFAISAQSTAYGWGKTDQRLVLRGIGAADAVSGPTQGERPVLYRRRVRARDGAIVRDDESFGSHAAVQNFAPQQVVLPGRVRAPQPADVEQGRRAD